MSWGIPDRDQNGHYVELEKQRRISEGKDFTPAQYSGPTLSSIYAQKRIEEKQAQAEQ